ncbi:MAG TPA: hypothetical protein PK843_19170 [bacterium]|nr:hypothetical protein [bacterium]
MRKRTVKTQTRVALLALAGLFAWPIGFAQGNPAVKQNRPKIVNIINFIRLLEPRDPLITEDVLYQTVVKQIELMKTYHLPGTFLLQYDALMDPRYQRLLKSLPPGSFEIGAWWEIPQPLAEKAGLKWRGRYPWDWHADVGFTTGYTPDERERLADVYMNDFENIFGYYAKSVASWFIDAHTLDYLQRKYNITASANCKDQYGTDGYTLWGGYWNQAYYPSKLNSYMPAQNAENQIPVPIFRMLGSDPIRQYDSGLGSNGQGVVTLEPVYKYGGGDSAWVNWYFEEFVNGECLEFAYTQAGQENSFTWEAMKKGLELQMPLLARLRDENKIRVETLAESGDWFRKNYKTTPATSVTVNKDLPPGNLKTVWFNSRHYRVNILWENNTLRIRDIHIFNENVPSVYEKEPTTSNECKFLTLPFVDGFLWSDAQQLAGLRLKVVVDGKEGPLTGGDPAITSVRKGTLHIVWPLKSIEGTFIMDLNEREMKMSLNSEKEVNWFLELAIAEKKKLPFTNITRGKIDCQFEGFNYAVKAAKGAFAAVSAESGFRIYPRHNGIGLRLAQ